METVSRLVVALGLGQEHWDMNVSHCSDENVLLLDGCLYNSVTIETIDLYTLNK